MTARLVVQDSDASTPCRITSYMHCAKCLEEWQAGTDEATGLPRRMVMAPKEYVRQQVGVGPGGIPQVWCNRHDCNIAVLTAMVQQ